ncbi:unnamed protein product [Mytilus coruscus]|uniref:Uncharacterized protein n=1 Tax=Mytilus coruscus TaxID=42192 RepID=A0A6J8AZ32_MYTCO|nr:unnamed protein product [Mytilus coruscus]
MKQKQSPLPKICVSLKEDEEIETTDIPRIIVSSVTTMLNLIEQTKYSRERSKSIATLYTSNSLSRSLSPYRRPRSKSNASLTSLRSRSNLLSRELSSSLDCLTTDRRRLSTPNMKRCSNMAVVTMKGRTKSPSLRNKSTSAKKLKKRTQKSLDDDIQHVERDIVSVFNSGFSQDFKDALILFRLKMCV